MAINTQSNLDFHKSMFINALINNKDYSNKNILIVKNSLNDGTANIIPDPAEKYENVIFLYVGAQASLTIAGATQVFKENNIYWCTKDADSTTYAWKEIELGGSKAWETVDIKATTPVDTPKESKKGTIYRVLSNGKYTTAWSGDTSSTKEHCNIGDILVCNAVNAEGKNAGYVKVPSSDDIQVEYKAVSELSTDTDWEITNDLGTDDAFVSFYLVETIEGTKTATPFFTAYTITPKTDTTDSKVTVHFDVLPESDDTAAQVKVIIHC